MAAVKAVRCVRLSNPMPIRASARLAAIFCALLVLPLTFPSGAQSPAPSIEIQVNDHAGVHISGAKIMTVSLEGLRGNLLGITDSNGHLTLPCKAPCALENQTVLIEDADFY